MRRVQRWLAAMLAAMLVTSLVACSPSATQPTPTPSTEATATPPAETTDTPAPSDAADPNAPTAAQDFYRYINHEWLAITELPADKMAVGGFPDLDEESKQTLKRLFDEGLAEGNDKNPDAIGKMLTLYGIANDYASRDAQGMEPIRAAYDALGAADTLDAFKSALIEYSMYASPFLAHGVSTDLADSTSYALFFQPSILSLGDKSYYDESSEYGQMGLAVLEAGYQSLFALAGQDEATAKASTQQALEIEKQLAQAHPSATDNADIAKIYNVMPLAQLDETTPLDLVALLKATQCPQPPETVVCTSPSYFEALAGIINDENLPQLRAYAQAQLLVGNAAYLSTDFLNAILAMNQQLQGTSASHPLDEYAFDLAKSYYPFPAGDLYVQHNFSEAARQDVTEMVTDMIATYKARLTSLDWMSEATKAKAIEKLDAITLKIGYPDSYPDQLADFTPKTYADGGTLMGNLLDATTCILKYQNALLGTKVDKTEWNTPPSTVNAFYSPTGNEIIFPAAILQAPFYDPARSRSENLGAIGSVIAHEISHAFDTNGSKFDKDGNMADWWTPEDYAAFEQRTQALVAQFDAATFAGQNINGTLTLTENIADLGGVGCALETAQALPDFDAEGFFTAYATQWRMKSTPQYEQMLLAMDTHAPNEARVNVVLPNFDVFLTTYGIVEGDAMYRAEADRLRIW